MFSICLDRKERENPSIFASNMFIEQTSQTFMIYILRRANIEKREQKQIHHADDWSFFHCCLRNLNTKEISLFFSFFLSSESLCWQNLSIVYRKNNLFSISIYLQISTLIQHRSERPHVTSATSERTLRAIGRVGQAVNLAVERFVTVGETIADDNPDIKQDMYDACKEARAAGENKSVPLKLFYRLNALLKWKTRGSRIMAQYVACIV